MYEEYKELTNKIRQDFSIKIRPYYLEDECLLCESKKDLHLHHMIPLSDVVEKVLKLNLTKEEKRTYALGLQIDNTFITICEKCHNNHPVITDVHRYKLKNGVRKYHQKQRSLKHQKHIDKYGNIYEVLPTLIQKRIYVGSLEQRHLVNILNIRDGQYRLQTSFNIIKQYIGFNTNLELTRNREYSNKNPETYRKTYWILNYKTQPKI